MFEKGASGELRRRRRFERAALSYGLLFFLFTFGHQPFSKRVRRECLAEPGCGSLSEELQGASRGRDSAGEGKNGRATGSLSCVRSENECLLESLVSKILALRDRGACEVLSVQTRPRTPHFLGAARTAVGLHDARARRSQSLFLLSCTSRTVMPSQRDANASSCPLLSSGVQKDRRAAAGPPFRRTLARFISEQRDARAGREMLLDVTLAPRDPRHVDSGLLVGVCFCVL
ncbi:uncharacterized protein BKA78DRAFT_155346 [Phyllosticta capitalensis]|uniref:Transmembrane protein n=1 Tax=Phyllosticta capitalensis TaxID=121624 RepID=A0ABR1YLS5_9PEZI